jgi:hypothetical protein
MEIVFDCVGLSIIVIQETIYLFYILIYLVRSKVPCLQNVYMVKIKVNLSVCININHESKH